MKKILLIMMFVFSLFMTSCGENETDCHHYGGGDYWDTPLYHCHCPGRVLKQRRRCGREINKRQEYTDKRLESQLESR